MFLKFKFYFPKKLKWDLRNTLIWYNTFLSGTISGLSRVWRNRVLKSCQEKIMPLISIIIPVFNAEKYLTECLDSVRGQTLEDVEILCVNDGSTDQSGTICDRYAAEDPRFRVIHQKNAGQSAARNRGLELALGKYVMFVDADDTLSPEACRKSLKKAQETGAEIVSFLFRHTNHPAKDSRIARKIKKNVFSEEMEKFRFTQTTLFTVWGRLYSRDLLEKRNIRFLDCTACEDNHFSVKAAFWANQIVLLDEFLYDYRDGIGYFRDTKQILKNMGIIETHANMLDEFRETMPMSETFHHTLIALKARTCSHLYRRKVPAELKDECRKRILNAFSPWEWELFDQKIIRIPRKLRWFTARIRGMGLWKSLWTTLR
ncbi:MAG: glycosyltransferase [Planctomycetaceae bacterium]|nr:glycosyltransferase [Planctomycetaceae bacterium]